MAGGGGNASVGGAVTNLAKAFEAEKMQVENEAYASAIADMRVKTKQLESEFEADSGGFSNAHNAYFEAASKNLSPRLQQRYREAALRDHDLTIIGIQEKAEAAQLKRNAEAAEDLFKASIEQGKAAARQGDLITSDAAREEMAVQLIELGHDDRTVAAAMDNYDNEVMREATLAAFRDSDDKPGFMQSYAGREDIDIDDQNKMLRTMQGMHKDDLLLEAQTNAEGIKQAAYEKALRGTELAEEVQSGVATYDDLNKALEAEDITPSQHKEYTLKLNKAVEKQAELFAFDAKVVSALTGPIKLDRNNKDEKAALDRYLMSEFGDPSSWGPNERKVAAQAIGRSGVIPPAMQSYMRTNLNSSDPEQVAIAAEMIDRALVHDENIDYQLAAPEKALADLVNRNIENGMSPEESVLLAQADLSATPEEKEARRMAFKEFEPDLELPSGWFDDKAPLEAQAAYKHLAEQHYMLTKDYDLSIQQAEKTIGKTWGESSVNGDDKFMMAPPEARYSVPGLDNDWMRNQLVEDFGPSAQIQSDGQTFRDGTYLVMSMDEDGFFKEVARWKPDATLTPEYQEFINDIEPGESAEDMIRAAREFRELKEQDFEPLIKKDRQDTQRAMVRPLFAKDRAKD